VFQNQGREYELFAKLAKKYGSSNPLDDLPNLPGRTLNPTPNITEMIDDPSQFMESSNETKQIHSSISTTSIQENSVSSGIVTSQFPSLPSQGMVLPSMSSSTPFSSPFGQASDSFANSSNSASSNTNLSTTSTGMFRGKSARELLTEFYREKNPSKISDVDNVLMKYQVRKRFDAKGPIYLYCLT
jgi:hypothetical protein